MLTGEDWTYHASGSSWRVKIWKGDGKIREASPTSPSEKASTTGHRRGVVVEEFGEKSRGSCFSV